MTEKDAQAILRILRRSLYTRMLAVKSGAEHEADPAKDKRPAHRIRFPFSLDAANRTRQVNYLWTLSVKALLARRVEYRPASVQARWAVPYRRRVYTDVNEPSLQRVNDVLDRVRTGLLETLVKDDFELAFETDDGRRKSQELLVALVDWDLPTVSRLAEDDVWIQQALRAAYGITEEELLAMSRLSGETWDQLALEDEAFGTFYDNGRSA